LGGYGKVDHVTSDKLYVRKSPAKKFAKAVFFLLMDEMADHEVFACGQ